MKRILMALCCLLLALPAFSQDPLTPQEWESIPDPVRTKLKAYLNGRTRVPFRLVQDGHLMVEDGSHYYYENNVFMQVPRDRKGQEDGNYVYNRWNDMTDIKSVYISPDLYGMVGTLPRISVRGKSVDLSSVIREFKGLYLLDFPRTRSKEPEVRYCRNTTSGGLRKDIRDFLDKEHYTTLMDMRKDGQYTRLYMVADADKVTGFVLVELDDSFDYGRFICLEGTMPRDKFENMMKEITR